jgi:SAM-dependent methyltransferase
MELSPALETRSNQSELMDGDLYTPEEYVECLHQLRTINRLTSGYRPTLQAVARFSRIKTDGALRVLDIGFGFGDTLREIALWAKRRGRAVELIGIDLQPLSAEIARAETPAWMPITYLTGDVFQHRVEYPYDVVINALFMHHLGDAEAVEALRWMSASSRLGFFVNDLHRHPLALGFIRHFTRLFRFNRLIRHDAPISVARSFCSGDWRRYSREAGLDFSRLDIRWHWAFRYGVRYEHSML